MCLPSLKCWRLSATFIFCELNAPFFSFWFSAFLHLKEKLRVILIDLVIVEVFLKIEDLWCPPSDEILSIEIYFKSFDSHQLILRWYLIFINGMPQDYISSQTSMDILLSLFFREDLSTKPLSKIVKFYCRMLSFNLCPFFEQIYRCQRLSYSSVFQFYLLK